VTPYFRQRGPRVGGDVPPSELLARLAGRRIEQLLALDRRLKFRRVDGGWTTATKSFALISKIFPMRSVESAMPPRIGTQPPT